MYFSQLTFTRFIAAIAIVIMHFGLFTWPFSSHYYSFPIMSKAVSAVSYFFVFSGFILVLSSVKENKLPEKIKPLKFWLNRCARILPLYFLSISIYFLFHYNPEMPLDWQTQSFIYSCFLFQAWKYPIALDVNYPAWTLSVEAFFYFIFPLLYKGLNYISSRTLIFISFFSWAGNTILFKYMLEAEVPHHLAYYFPLFHVATFIVGVTSGILFVRHYRYLSGKATLLAGTVAVTTILLLAAAYTNLTFFYYQHNGLLSPYFILVLYSFAVSKGIVIKIVSSWPFVFLGNISYSVYLLQVPVLEISKEYIGYFRNREVKDFFFLYLLLLFIISTAVYFIIEKPLRNSIKNLL